MIKWRAFSGYLRSLMGTMSSATGSSHEELELAMISSTLDKLGEARTRPVPRPAPIPATGRKPRRGWLGWLLLLAIGGGVYYAVPRELWKKMLPGAAAKETKPTAPKAIPVVVADVRSGDMDLYLNGLGSVTPLFTVVLRTRVDGELIKVGFKEGQVIRQGDLLAEIDPRPFQAQLKQAEGQLLKDQAALKLAQLDWERYEKLKQTKSVTQQQLDTQLALVQQNQGLIEIDQAQIENVKLQLTYCRITAPISGRVGLRLVDPGNIVHANDVTGLAVLNQVQPITVVFTVPQDEIARVQRRINSGDALPVEAFDREIKTKLATGTLMAIDNQVDVATGTVKLKASFKNEDNMLFPNQFVNARLLVDTKHDAVLIPTTGVQRGPDFNFVYVVKPDETVDIRTVLVGPTEGEDTAIESGLSPGEVVVIDGVDKLQPGAKIAARERHNTPTATQPVLRRAP